MTLSRHVLDPNLFRSTLGHHPTGVVLVTAIDADGEPVGMVVGSFTSVSLHPPLIAFFPTRESRRFARLRTAESFCVNVLAHDQGELCRAFAGKGGNDFTGVRWSPAPSGAPVLDGVVAWIDCAVDSIGDAGDHHLVLGRVHDLEVVNPVAPLLFFQGGYGRFAPLSVASPADSDLIAAVRTAENARVDVERLAEDLRTEVTVLAAVGGDLAVVAAASGAAEPGSVALGTRVPLRPPLGELYVAWEGSDAARRWLDSAVGVDACTRSQYEERLRAARRRGWSLSLAEPPGPRLADYLIEYSAGHLTPARERELDEAIARASARYAPVELHPEERYDVGSLVAPVFDRDGQVAFVLRLGQLPPGATGAEVRGWLDRLLAATDGLTRRFAAETTR